MKTTKSRSPGRYVPPPPPQVEQLIPSTPNSSDLLKKQKQKLINYQQLPLTPPSLPLPTLTNLASQKLNLSPSSVLLSPNPTPSNDPNKSYRVSKSVDSPRLPINETSTPTNNKLRDFEKLNKK